MAIDRTHEVRRHVGTNVNRERLRQHFTQAELAQAAGVEHRTLQRLEAGATARLSTVVAVADALGVPVWRLFRPPRRSK